MSSVEINVGVGTLVLKCSTAILYVVSFDDDSHSSFYSFIEVLCVSDFIVSSVYDNPPPFMSDDCGRIGLGFDFCSWVSFLVILVCFIVFSVVLWVFLFLDNVKSVLCGFMVKCVDLCEVLLIWR